MANEPTINIKRINGHYMVYVNRKFFCSTDTFSEAVDELKKEGII